MATDILSNADWRRINELLATIASCPLGEPDHATRLLFEGLQVLLDCQRAFIVFAERLSEFDPDDLLSGWRATHVIHNPTPRMEEIDTAYAENWSKKAENYAFDEYTQALTASSGRRRTFLREDVLGDRPWSECGAREILAVYGVHDRMVSGYPLTPGVEVYFGLDRVEKRAFDRRERDILHETVHGLGPLSMRLALSYGLLNRQMKFAPRERETLLNLLDGLTEKEIAQVMGLTTRSAHQYVTKVFRKFGVSSRAQLMAFWINPPLSTVIQPWMADDDAE